MNRTPLLRVSKRKSVVDRQWKVCKDIVLKRANYKCKLCDRPTDIVHHIWGRRTAPHLLTHVCNCIALCFTCHASVHDAPKEGNRKIENKIGIEEWNVLEYLSLRTGKGKSQLVE